VPRMSHAFDTRAPGKFTAVMRRALLARGLSMLLACATFGACSANEPDKNPVEVLAHFLEAMDRSAHDEAALRDAYALLDESARRELEARAERTSSLAGRNFAPWEMIAQGRFRLRFVPAEHAGMRASVAGDDAWVHVKSEDGRKADVPLVREHGAWRVKLELALPGNPRAQNGVHAP
jgi:hypothetical protein